MRQAGAEIEISLEANYVGGKLLAKLVGDPNFMAKPNWSGELASRVYKVMASQAAYEDTLAIPSKHEKRSAFRPLFSERRLVP